MSAILITITIRSVSAADKVRVGIFPVSSALPYFVALERGYFEEQNIETIGSRLMGGPPLVGAMIGNQIDVATNLVTIEGMNANLKKPNVAIYIAINGQNKQYQMEQFVVRSGHPAKTIGDLKGAKILSAPGPANMSMAHAVLAANGLKRGDYRLDQLAMPQHVGALKAGTFDAGYTLEPNGMVAVDLGVVRRLEAGVISTYILKDDHANTYAAGCALTSEFINGRPNVAKRFAAAWAKAVHDIKTDTAGVRKHLIKNTFTSPEIAPTIPMVNYTMVKDLTPKNIANFQAFIDFAHQAKVLKSTVDVKKYLKKY
jgi:NitT/TauT family transport system substrate-binding protein